MFNWVFYSVDKSFFFFFSFRSFVANSSSESELSAAQSSCQSLVGQTCDRKASAAKAASIEFVSIDTKNGDRKFRSIDCSHSPSPREADKLKLKTPCDPFGLSDLTEANKFSFGCGRVFVSLCRNGGDLHCESRSFEEFSQSICSCSVHSSFLHHQLNK